MHSHLLPPNATLLERTVDQTLPAGWVAMAGQVEPLANPPALLPWVAQQWQISQFESYFPTTQALLNAGLPWLRERGSAAAVRRAMGWLGYKGVRIEEDGALLHIDPGKEITAADLRYLAHVVKASIPLHVHFYRVYHRLDKRMLRLNRKPGLNSGLLQADSGTPMDAGDGTTILVSQGKYSGGVAPRITGRPIVGSACRVDAGRMRRIDAWLLNVYRLGAGVRRPWAGGASTTNAGTAPAYQRLAVYGDTVGGTGWHNGLASSLGQPVAGSNSTAGRNVRRTVPNRTWETGVWDGDTWQRSDVAGGNIVIQDNGE